MAEPPEIERRRLLIAERARKQFGLEIDEYRNDEDGDIEGVCGRWVVVEDNEEKGIYEGEEGELHFAVVGAPKYSNERVAVYFYSDDTEGPAMGEVTPFEDIEPVDG